MSCGRRVLIGSSALAALLLLAAGCGGSSNKASPAELKSRLLPVSQVPGFTLYRPFKWKKSVDFVVQGIPMSETTAPSQGVDAAEDSGFQAGAAEELRKNKEPPGVTIEAIKLKSHKGAERLLEFVHAEGLKYPCYGSCSELPSNLPVPAIPGAKGIQQLPQPVPPPGSSVPFAAYGVGFSIDNYLYLVGGGGDPSSLKKSFILDLARKQYEHVRGS